MLTSAIVIVDTMLYAALVPLLPHYADEFGLSKGKAGVVVAAYAAGALLAAIPAGLFASRFGPKPAAVAGLALVAAASVGFGFADGFVPLVLARFAQGVGSAFSWTGALAWLVAATPRDRRGEMLGTAIGSAVFGAMLGPVVGAVASVAGSTATFTATAAVAAALAAWAARMPGTPAEPQSLLVALRVAWRPTFVAALWLVLLPSLLFGVVSVLVPLRLDAAGWGAVAIGVAFLVAAAIEVVVAPVVGKVSDRVGRLTPLRWALAAATAVSLAFAWISTPAVIALLLVLAAIAFGAFWAPAMALLVDAAEQAGLAQGLAFSLLNLAWAAGNVVGPAAGGGLADLAGDALPFLISGGICIVTLTVVGLGHRPGTRVARVPGDS